jgi:hypothetical protein
MIPVTTRGCPLCAARLADITLAGAQASLCTACAAVSLPRPVVRTLAISGTTRDELPDASREALRPADASLPSALSLAAHGADCPACGGALSAFRFGGGTTPALSCPGCDRVVFPGGGLSRAIDEQRHGSAMSKEQRSTLRDMRLGAALVQHIHAGEVVLFLGLVSIYFLLRLARVGLPAWAFVLAAIGVVAWVGLRVRAARAHGEEAVARAERLADAVPFEDAERRRASPSPKHEPAAMRATSCAWCGAPLAAKATRCNACDSDFG